MIDAFIVLVSVCSLAAAVMSRDENRRLRRHLADRDDHIADLTASLRKAVEKECRHTPKQGLLGRIVSAEEWLSRW